MENQSTTSTEAAAITVATRVPDFWQDQPRVWFIQLEAVVASQKLGDEAKYQLTIAKLGKNVISQVTGILLRPPETNKYGTLKQRLLEIYEESEAQQVHKLIGGMDLGDQKPSQLLRSMQELARGKIPDSTLNILWKNHLPPPVRAVLAATDSAVPETLAAVADRVMEATAIPQLAEVKAESRHDAEIAELIAEVRKLTTRLDHVERDRSRSRGPRQRRFLRRSSSRKLQTPNSPEELCYYHYKFGKSAYKCEKPCTWSGN